MPTSGGLTRRLANPDGSVGEPGGDGEDHLLAILARATTPVERLRQRWLRTTDPDLGAARFDRWLRSVADGDTIRADQVLADRGLSADEWRTALGGVELAPAEGREAADLPAWVAAAIALYQLLAAPPPDDADDAAPPRLAEVAGDELPSWVDPDQPWQFYPGFRAWLDAAAGEVATWVADAAAPLSPAAQRELTLSLARRMLPVAGPQLMAEVQRRALAGGPRLFSQHPAVDWMTLWERLPVMARLQATVWRQWHDATAELVARIGADLPLLSPGAAVASVRTGAGDQHADGRGVAVLHLDDGTRWFVKPRSAGPQPVVAACYAALDRSGEPLALALPESHPRDGCTWVREVTPGQCQDTGQVDAYFRRAGAALRVLQTLGATDLHHENFIATASQPVLVDLETAVGPGSGWRVPGRDATGSVGGVAGLLADTPTATSMVTSPVDGPAGTVSVDIGALAGPSQRCTPYEVASLTLTEDGPRLRRARLPLITGSSLPVMADERVSVAAHVAAVVDGYLAAQHRLAAITDPAALLDRAAPDAEVRFVARPTQVYVRLGQQGLTSEALADGVARELVLERLWRAYGSCPSALISAEHAALRDLDVPLFMVPMSTTDLITDRGERIPAALVDAPAAEALRRLTRLRDQASARDGRPTGDDGADDLRAALFAATALTHPTDPVEGADRLDRRSATPPDPAATVLALAHDQPDGNPAWLGLDYDPTRHRWHHERLGPGLLGEAGIGLALVASGLAAPSPDATVHRDTVRIGRQALLASGRRLSRLRLGWAGADAFSGPAGTLYALARAATWTDDALVLETALEAIGPVLAAAEQEPAGPSVDAVAGGLLALAWLPPSSARDTAADRLVEALTAAPGRPARDDVVVDPWDRSLPSGPAGRLLAAHRWGLTDMLQCLLPNVRATATADAWRPVDATVLALIGEPMSVDDWHRDWLPRATTSHRLLDCATMAAGHLRATSDPHWASALETARTRLVALAWRTGRWFGDVIAPDTRNLSAVHGLAAITLLGIADQTTAPDARTFG